jgi:tRNA (mo5U34)-methyltransferase
MSTSLDDKMQFKKIIETRVRQLGDWFQNFNLNGVQTAPYHPLGDYPSVKWQRFSQAIPNDLTGKTVLDIGSNAGFYSFEMKKRGATRVLGIDTDEKYLRQAEFVREILNLDVEFRQMSVYEVATLKQKFDLVLFLGVLYHLRHPLLALDLIREHVCRDLFVIQSMLRGSPEIFPVQPNYSFWEREIFLNASYPRLFFIEQQYAGDPTNWWIPNQACLEAMLRSAGFEPLSQPEEEVYICRTA